jgi:hypothetical protein
LVGWRWQQSTLRRVFLVQRSRDVRAHWLGHIETILLRGIDDEAALNGIHEMLLLIMREEPRMQGQERSENAQQAAFSSFVNQRIS